MRIRSVCGVLLLLLFASACDDPGPTVADAGATSAPQPRSDVTLTSAGSARPEALWNEYKSIHTNATLQNSVATGQRIDDLLSDEARELIANTLSDSMRGVRPDPIRAKFALDIMRQRILGESAAVRRDHISQYSIVRPRAAPS